MRNSKIEWCDSTWNSWVGCSKVSPGCAHCYADAMTKRFGRDFTIRTRTTVDYWKQPLIWNRQAEETIRRIKADIGNASEYNDIAYERPRVFCGSMCDWLDDQAPIEWFLDLLGTIHVTRNLDWLLLTKRPQNWLSRMETALKHIKDVSWGHMSTMQLGWQISSWLGGLACWPNVWIGTTVEDQTRADERIPILLSIPANVRFLSCEPLLGSIDLTKVRFPTGVDENVLMRETTGTIKYPLNAVDWVICGGESGPNARPMDIEWARSLRDQCATAGVPFYMKQMGGRRKPFPSIPEDLDIKQFP